MRSSSTFRVGFVAVVLLVGACKSPQQQATSPCANPPLTADNAPAKFREFLDDAIARISDSKHLGRTLTAKNPDFKVFIELANVHYGNVTTQATTCPRSKFLTSGPAISCDIHINPDMEGMGVDANLYAVIAHEVFHCFQATLGTVDDYLAIKQPTFGWVGEGQPEWVAQTITTERFGPATTTIQSLSEWSSYLGLEETSLLTREYSALGFYGELDYVGVSPWTIIDKQLLTAAATSKPEDAFDVAVNGAPTFLDSWGPGVYRRADFGKPWTINGPGLPPPSLPGMHNVPDFDALAPSSVKAYSAPPFTLLAKDLAIGIRAVVLISAEGHVRLHDDATLDIARVSRTTVCMGREDCQCPDGPPLTLPGAVSPLHLALTAGKQASTIRLESMSLDDYCRNRPQPPPPTPPAGTCGGGGCAKSANDPHLRTYDGLGYDSQAVGEFVLSRSTTDAFEIQARQRPWMNSRFIAVNTAFAMNVAGDVVGFSLVSGGINVEARLNHAVIALADDETRRLAAGGTVQRKGRNTTVTWPDGTQAFVNAVGDWALRLEVKPAAARAGAFVGLFGNFDSNLTNDLVSRTGTTVAIAPVSFEDLYHVVGDSWRVRQEESLFDYAAGESTATFTDLTFPDRFFRVNDLSAGDRAAAEAICRAAGVFDPILLEDCILDVAVTGHAEFADATKAEQDLFTSPLPNGTIAIDGAPATLSIPTADATASVTFTGTSGQKIFVDVTGSSLPDQCGVVTLSQPNGASLGSACIVQGSGFIDALTLPQAGTYRLTLDPAGNATGTAQVRVTSATDQGGPIAIDGAPVVASVLAAGATSRFGFTGTAGQRLFVDVQSSTLPDQCGVLALVSPGGTSVTGCITGGNGFIDATTLASPGTWTVVVDPSARSTGTATLRLLSVSDQQGSVTVGGAAVNVMLTGLGQRGRFGFQAAASDQVQVDVIGSTMPDGCGFAWVESASGAQVATGCVVNGSGTLGPVTLSAAGTYTVVFDPVGRGLGALSFLVRNAP